MLTGVPGRRLSRDYLGGAIGDRSVQKGVSYVYTCTLTNRHDNQVWRSDTAPARVSDSPRRHIEAAPGGVGRVRGRLGAGAGV